MFEIAGVDTGNRGIEQVGDVFDIVDPEDCKLIRHSDPRLMDRLIPEFSVMDRLHKKSTRFRQSLQKFHPHCPRAGLKGFFRENMDLFLSGKLQGFDKCMFAQRILGTGKVPVAFSQKIICAELMPFQLIAGYPQFVVEKSAEREGRIS